MHDLSESILSLETKLFLCSLVYEVKRITLAELNYRIKTADYGFGNRRNKPSCILESHLKSSDANLGQHAAQMLTLFQYLPVIISDMIHRADSKKKITASSDTPRNYWDCYATSYTALSFTSSQWFNCPSPWTVQTVFSRQGFYTSIIAWSITVQ